jgi:hypothetical protein
MTALLGEPQASAQVRRVRLPMSVSLRYVRPGTQARQVTLVEMFMIVGVAAR